MKPEPVRALLIDDDLSILGMTRLVLESAGFDVITATSGTAGLELARKSRADATLTDGTHLIAVDVTLDGHRYGQRFDFVIGRPDGQGQ